MAQLTGSHQDDAHPTCNSCCPTNGHLVSVNATTPVGLLNMRLQDYIGAVNCHIPGKLWSKLFDLSHCI